MILYGFAFVAQEVSGCQHSSEHSFLDSAAEQEDNPFCCTRREGRKIRLHLECPVAFSAAKQRRNCYNILNFTFSPFFVLEDGVAHIYLLLNAPSPKVEGHANTSRWWISKLSVSVTMESIVVSIFHGISNLHPHYFQA